MSEHEPIVAGLTIDIRRCRFRIHQKTLCGLGYPSYIQFLVHPEDGFIAILGSDKPLPGGTANRVQLHNGGMKNNPATVSEFYSTHLMNKIFALYGIMDFTHSYWLSGEIDQVNRVAYFSIKTLQRAERSRAHGKQRLQEPNHG